MQHADPDDPFSSTSKAFAGFVSASASHLQNVESGRISPESGHSDHDDGVGGSTAPMIGFTSASNFSDVLTSFASASALLRRPVSPSRRGSPSPQQSQNLDDQTHTDARPDSFDCTGNDASVNPLAMFTSFGKKKNPFQLSAAALKAAEERAKRWAAEDDSILAVPPDAPSDKHADVEIPRRQALLSVENLSQRSTVTGHTISEPTNAPSVNQQVGFSSASRVDAGGTFRSGTHFSTPSALGSTSFQTPSVSNIKGKSSVKPFKSPLISRPAVRTPGNRQILPSLLNPATSTPARGTRPAVLDSFARPAVVTSPEARFTTPIPNRSTPIRKIPVRKFVTPFKPGMRPGEQGHAQLKTRHDSERANTISGPNTNDTRSTSDLTRKPTRRRFFDLSMLCHVCFDGEIDAPQRRHLIGKH
jgi:breast cancer 2 susceptibility protein